MNRRGFVGTALAGLGGFLFPQKLFAEAFSVPDYLSTGQIFERISCQSQYWCSIFLKQPVKCDLFGRSALFTHNYLCNFDSFANGLIFGDKGSEKREWFAIDNIDVIYICHEQNNNPWRLYDHVGNGQWLIYKDHFSRRGE